MKDEAKSNNRDAVMSTGWLGAEAVYYNDATNTISSSIHDVIDYSNLEFDPEGLNDYLDFGFSVFGQTPIKNVRYLRSNESLRRNVEGKLVLHYNKDPALEWLSKVTPESEAWDSLDSSISGWAKSNIKDSVLIPTSGGLDSRLLNHFYPDKRKVVACTYGISRDQSKSFEVVYGQAVAKRLGVRWDQVILGNYHRYFSEWNDMYGVSTHAHGMYHWEFYSNIRERYGAMPMLSGIVGDAWAGAPLTSTPRQPSELVKLGYSHGMVADSNFCLMDSKYENREKEFVAQKKLLENERYRILYLVRSKMVLLSYLINVPNALGFSAYSPFLDKEVALRMLTVEPMRWKNRVWQYDYIQKNNLNVEAIIRGKSRRNDLNFYAMQQVPLNQLDISLLCELFDTKYLEWINSNIDANKISTRLLRYLMGVRKVGGGLRSVGLTEPTLKAYFAYLVLKPIEYALIRSRGQ